MMQFVRTCQSCNHKQVAIPPNPHKELTNSYLESKCRKCKSADLDYGSDKEYPPTKDSTS